MTLENELNRTIESTQQDISELESRIESLKRNLARLQQVEADALRLYKSTTGEEHPLARGYKATTRKSPRADRVMAVLESAGRPVTLTEVVAAMPDDPQKGAITAVLHRAIKKGDARRLEPGVYESTRRLAEAS